MKEKNNFEEKRSVEKIVSKYQEKEQSKLDELRALDKKARFNAIVFAYVFGIVAALVLGFGMCVAMKVILIDYTTIGIVVGLIGIFMCSINYSIYKVILNKGIKKYSSQILKLSKELLNE